MARRHGRNGRVYIDIAGGGSASSVNFMADWTIDQKTDRVDVTGMGDTNKVKVAGLPDFTGSLNGWWDDATPQTYTAAADGNARKFYLYPDISNAPTVYWYGTAFFDFSAAGGVEKGVSVSSTFDAAGVVAKNG